MEGQMLDGLACLKKIPNNVWKFNLIVECLGFVIYLGSCGSIKNWLEPKTKPIYASLILDTRCRSGTITESGAPNTYITI